VELPHFPMSKLRIEEDSGTYFSDIRLVSGKAEFKSRYPSYFKASLFSN